MFRRLDKSLVIVGIGLLVGASMGLIFTALQNAGVQITELLGGGNLTSSQPRLDHKAPDFELRTLEGEKIRLSSLQGVPVIINFWATWCGPCRLEMPLLQQAHQDYPELMILAVNADEAASDVENYITEIGLTFPVLLDPGAKLEELYLVNGLPTSYFVDREGVIRAFQIGILSEAQLSAHLAKIGIGK